METFSVKALLFQKKERGALKVRRLIEKLTPNLIVVEPDEDFAKNLEAIDSSERDILLFDENIGREMTLSLLEEASLRKRDAPLLVIASEEDEEFERAVLEAGALDRLPANDLAVPLLRRSIRYAIDRKRDEARLKESESLYHSLFNHAPLGIAYSSLSGRFLSVNPRYCEIMGYSSDELLKMSFQEMTDPSDVRLDLEARRDLLDGEIVQDQCAMRYRKKDGSSIWASRSLSLIRDSSGAPARFLALVEDVSLQKRVDDDLRSIAENAKCLLWFSEVNRSEDDMMIWKTRFFNEEAAQRVIPLSVRPGENYLDAFYRHKNKSDVRENERLLKDAFANRDTSYVQEYRVTDRDGEIRWLRESVALKPMGKSEWRAFGVSIDITSHKEAKRAIEFQENLLDIVNEAVIVTDHKGVIAYWNRYAERLYGWSKREAFGRGIYELFPDAEGNGYEEEIASFLKEGRSWSGELRVRDREESKLTVLFNASPLRDDDDEWSGMVCISSDISELKRKEAALRESEAMFRSFIEQSPLSVQIFSADGDTLQVNRSFEEMWGISAEAMREYNILKDPQLIRLGAMPDIVKCFQGEWVRLKPVLYDAKESPLHSVNKTKADKRWALATLYPVKDQTDSVRMVILIHEDITEKKSLEDRLLHSQKMEAIGRLAGGVAHDFNNLLSVINGYSELLLSRLDEKDPISPPVRQMKRAGERAAGLVRQLLAFSRNQDFAPRILELNQAERDIESLLLRLIGEDIELETQLSKEELWIKTDPSQLEQIIMNLVINARDAMPSGGYLSIRTEKVSFEDERDRSLVQPGRYARISIQDTGTGMTPDVIERIYEPFYTTKETGKGTGLGLSTVYGIVKRSDGAIVAESEPGEGSTFNVYLPLSDPKEAEPEPEDRPNDSDEASVGTILLVDDEVLVREVAKEILESCGYRVLVAADGAEAVHLCELDEEPIHLLLTDIIMPRMNGLDAAEAIQTIRPEIVTLYMSGYKDEDIVDRGIVASSDRFIQKPFSMAALQEKVRHLLKSSS